MNLKKVTALASAMAIMASMIAVPAQTVGAEEPRTITVGKDADDDFSSIRDAVSSITVSPESEEGRITINVDPGDYEEQVKLEGLKYITLQQTPGTEGRVNLHWYYCTGYCAGDCGLDGNYDPKVNWSDPRTWNGYKEGDEKFTSYRLGQQMTKGSTISYYDTDGTAHKDVKVQKDHLGDFNDQAALFINNSSSDITVKDFNIVNSIPVMVTAGEKKVGVAPQEDRNADNATSYVLPRRDNLAICDESTEMDGTARLTEILAMRDDVQKVKALEALTDLTAGESAYLARSDKYNERGHAVSANGDRIIFDGIRLRGNQDSLYISTGRMYFKDCDLIGGTDYIYGDATAVFDNCKLGAEGMSNKNYGATVTAANHDGKNPYGYLFYNCELYNMLDNMDNSQLGRPWRQDAQITFYNTLIDDTKTTGASKAGISEKGWSDMSGNEAAKARFYEYGTHTRSGAAVDMSKRLVNENGFGSVLNDIQILEFNPRNYFNNDFWLTTKNKSAWDPMNFADTYLKEVDAQIAASTINVPAGEETEITLPASSDSNIEFSWASASTNAIVSADGTKLTVVRPAAGEEPINTTVTLYARNKTTGLGDKKDIPVTIAATTDTTNVFNIPVKISQSASADNNYSISISKNGALIKSQTIAVSGTSADAVVENIPASADGIDYDIRIVSESDEFTIIAPADGATAVKGVTGKDVALDITAQKLVDSTQKLDIASKAADGDKIYDIIALAKAAGADGIENSDSVKLTFDITVNAKPSKHGYIDISSGTPKSSNSAEAARFTEIKINNSWVQLDSVDCTQGFSGSSNGDGQCLNLCGKFSYPCTQTVSAVINYKDGTVSVEGSNLKEAYTFKGFPEGASKGIINMGVFPGSTGDDYEISNVKVTYKKIITGTEPTPEPLPSGEGTYKFPANNESVTNGNQCDNNDGFVFVDGVKDEVKALFADPADSTKMDAALVKNYKNYISGTSDRGSHPQIKLDAPKGLYRIYFAGYNHGNNVTASVGGKTFTAEPGVQLAAKENNAGYVLKYYVIDIELAESGDTIIFDSTDQWLPDLYCIVVTGREAVQPATPAPSETPTQAPATATPTAAPATATPTAAPATATPTAPPTDPMIVSAVKENGKTTVTTMNITDGVIIAVDYDDKGAVLSVKTAPVASEPVVIDGIEADKVLVWNSLKEMKPLCAAYKATIPSPATAAPTAAPATTAPTAKPTASPTSKPAEDAVTVDFTAMSTAPAYTADNGQGFVEKSDAIMAEQYRRQVAPVSSITVSSDGAKITESDGAYIEKPHKDTNVGMDGETYNYGGLIYRIDMGAPGAYHLEVEVTGTSADTKVAPTGMDASRLTGTGTWDTGGHVAHTVFAKWDSNVWSYDFATGEDFIEIEAEPSKLPTASAPQTVGIKKITVTPIKNNAVGNKPTIHILGDSTQKTYTFNETISAWGQTLVNYFDPEKVNVINYSMGGRSMRGNYSEGRFGEVLLTGKEGDFVFIHSAHNDETVSNDRFGRGAAVDNSGTAEALAANNANQLRWMDMYVSAIKARGMTPVFVTAMPRTSSGRYSESDIKPNGFNPDSPGNMRLTAAADSEVGLVELYEGAKAYIDKLDAKEVSYFYNNFEAGEVPANNSANGTNGDGTHYREAGAKMWSRIILQSIYDQSTAAEDTYKDKDIMTSLTALMPDSVVNAAKTGDWSEVFPEMASDVSAVDVVKGAQKQEESNYYYRNNIEKALQVGLLHKDTNNLFKPNDIITVGEFARGAEKAFGLEENSLSSYEKTYAELTGGASVSGLAELNDAVDYDYAELVDFDYAELADGECAVTVTQPEGGAVTVYNESAFHTAVTDITSDVAADQQLADNDYYTFTAPLELVKKNDKNGAGIGEGISADAIELRNNGTKQAKYTAKADGILTMYLMFVDHKLISCENKTTGETSQKYINNTTIAGETKANQYAAVTFDVKAGNEYEIYTNGGTGRLFGIRYESTDYPQSTTVLKVNVGDVIRVTAVPDEYYVNGRIIVNGADASDKKEYTFTAEGNTEVTASFVKEPGMVETTAVASDAALTREIMGAILYDAYQKIDKNSDGYKNMQVYMGQTGGVPSPDDPSYDPNIKYEGATYMPLTGWGALEDINNVSDALYQKVKAAYNSGLIRSETGIARGAISNGTLLEPKTQVTRAKAAKSLVFAWMLTQNPKDGNHTIAGRNGECELSLNKAAINAAEIEAPNPDAPSSVFDG